MDLKIVEAGLQIERYRDAIVDECGIWRFRYQGYNWGEREKVLAGFASAVGSQHFGLKVCQFWGFGLIKTKNYSNYNFFC